MDTRRRHQVEGCPQTLHLSSSRGSRQHLISRFEIPSPDSFRHSSYHSVLYTRLQKTLWVASFNGFVCATSDNDVGGLVGGDVGGLVGGALVSGDVAGLVGGDWSAAMSAAMSGDWWGCGHSYVAPWMRLSVVLVVDAGGEPSRREKLQLARVTRSCRPPTTAAALFY
jgi:hypothetical protein